MELNFAGSTIDSKGRDIKLLQQNGKVIPYYNGLDGQGIIVQDGNKEYIKVNNEKRYWRGGIIKPLPKSSRFRPVHKFGIIVLKPDTQQRGLTRVIMSIFKDAGFKICARKDIIFDRSLFFKMYPTFFSLEWERKAVQYMASGISCCLLVKGNGQIVPKLLQVRNEIRKKFWAWDEHPGVNLVHCADTHNEAIREVLHIFTLEKLLKTVNRNT